MASGAPLRKVLEEATCSICLEYLTEPVTIDCGHNFCRVCITQYSEQREPESDTKFPCPQCRVLFQKQKLQPNMQLADIVENIKKLRLQPRKEQKKNLCERHQEKLQLFCEEDREAICLVCRESRAHRAHVLLPIQEAALDYKVKLQGALGPLRKQLEECLALVSKEEKKTTEQSITCEFKKLHQFLSEEEQLLLRRLAEEERETLQRLQDNITKLSEQSAALINLITELEEKCQQPAFELMKVKLLTSPSLPAALNSLVICLDMREMLERFTVDVTLDPDTAHPNLVLYEDRKCVRHGDTRQDLPDNPERFDCCHCVLGTEGFTGGRCYWEVEVGDMTDWMLGVCRESVSRKGWVILTTENGYWAMWLWDGEYKVLTSPRTSLPVSVRPSRVGIFLDYEAGEVSFYNVTDRSHLFTFTGTFSGTLRPYFCPGLNSGGKNAAPLIICPGFHISWKGTDLIQP
uniref:E3 ubiquitin-protein ligase TRIM39-like n=1 Tax=Chelydra serpentina TaxID=8475 RepID=A0A8C3XM54_CHESE